MQSVQTENQVLIFKSTIVTDKTSRLGAQISNQQLNHINALNLNVLQIYNSHRQNKSSWRTNIKSTVKSYKCFKP